MNPVVIKIFTIAGVITGGLAIGFGGGFLIGHFAKPKVPDYSNIDINDVEDDNEGLLTRYEQCKSDGKDPVNEFTIAELANISQQKFAASEKSIAYGYGTAKSAVSLDIRNAAMRNGDEYLEESLSKSRAGAVVNVVVAQRDYQHGNTENSTIDSYVGSISSNVEEPDWSNPTHTEYTISSYEEKFGKTVSRNSVYIVSSKSVLEDSTVTKTSEGYTIYMNLHTSKGVARYIKRMMNLSGSDVKTFEFVHLTYYVDSDFNLIKSVANEKYAAGMGGVSATVTGELTTYFFTGVNVHIPEINEVTDYPQEGNCYA